LLRQAKRYVTGQIISRRCEWHLPVTGWVVDTLKDGD